MTPEFGTRGNDDRTVKPSHGRARPLDDLDGGGDRAHRRGPRSATNSAANKPHALALLATRLVHTASPPADMRTSWVVGQFDGLAS